MKKRWTKIIISKLHLDFSEDNVNYEQMDNKLWWDHDSNF